MKILYLDCGMGAAGDMLSSALFELIDNKKEFLENINSAGIPSVIVTAENSVKCGISGTHLRVKINGEEEGKSCSYHSSHHHNSLTDIEHIINHLSMSEKVKKNVVAVYKMIAFAESKVHNVPVSEIHFHEVGALDAIADIAMFCMLVDLIGADKIVASPVNVGSGKVACAHGILPVPAPATAEILKGISAYSNGIDGELCTPTGAALLKFFVNYFSDMPYMAVDKIGYGMGTKDFETANCVRAFIGTAENDADDTDSVVELSCNIDDMTAEELSFAADILLDSGALDVFTSPVVMKKGRLGSLLTVICKSEDKDKFVKLIFKHTSTIGIRESIHKRYVMNREICIAETEFGAVKIKNSSGYGTKKSKFEYENLARICRENNISLDKLKSLL